MTDWPTLIFFVARICIRKYDSGSRFPVGYTLVKFSQLGWEVATATALKEMIPLLLQKVHETAMKSKYRNKHWNAHLTTPIYCSIHSIHVKKIPLENKLHFDLYYTFTFFCPPQRPLYLYFFFTYYYTQAKRRRPIRIPLANPRLSVQWRCPLARALHVLYSIRWLTHTHTNTNTNTNINTHTHTHTLQHTHTHTHCTSHFFVTL